MTVPTTQIILPSRPGFLASRTRLDKEMGGRWMRDINSLFKMTWLKRE